MDLNHASSLTALVSLLEKATHAYHNGLEPVMTDDAYDAALERLKALAPTHPFLSRVGAQLISVKDEVVLPIPLPSLNKIKTQEEISRWIANPVCKSSFYRASAKLDGCSALWLPQSRKLYTRGNGIKGRDISGFVKYFKGFPAISPTNIIQAVRGELVMRTDSPAVPKGKLARNIVAGALNRPKPDPELFAEIRFVPYELIAPLYDPETAQTVLIAHGYEEIPNQGFEAKDLTPAYLTEVFTELETESPYQIDGIVVAPNRVRTSATASATAAAANPIDRVAWKTRAIANTARTTVRDIEWNISSGGFLIPRVLFDSVTLAGANISAATGLHGRWIYENCVGPGSEIEIRRAGDVIPQIVAVHTPSTSGQPAMPPDGQWNWVDPFSSVCVHIKPIGDATADAAACIQLTKALSELGAENVGPGVVAKLYAGPTGLKTLRAIYAASVADFTRIDGIQQRGAERIYTGLRAKQGSWTELNFLVASCKMPRGVGHTKLAPLLALEPNPAIWTRPDTIARFKSSRPPGVSDATIDAIVEVIPLYLAWKADTGFTPIVPLTPSLVPPALALAPAHIMTVVFTGVRDKELEARLTSNGHIVADSVTKKTTHVVHADGAETNTVKIKKARDAGIEIVSLSEMRTFVS